MGRSTIFNSTTTKRRKSLRRQSSNEAQQEPTAPIENFGRAAAADDKSSSKSLPSLDDGPSSRTRRRSAGGTDINQSDVDGGDKKLATKAEASKDKRSSTTRSGKKRASSLSSASANSDHTEERQSKMSKKEATFSVARKITREMTVASETRMTRSRRKLMINQVTPSPQAGERTFHFNSPISKQRKKDSPDVPRGVVNLYPSTTTSPHVSCKCEEEHCSSKALSASFIQSYGQEYWQNLKDEEEPLVVPPSPTSASSKSSCMSSPRSSCDSSVFSTETPDVRRAWVHIDTNCVETKQPKESTRFLHYQPELTPKMRSILVDWLIELSEHFCFRQQTLHLAITLVDKVLACGPLSMDEDEDDYWNDDRDYDDFESKTNCYLISRERFQLLGATCTWLACKVEELSPPTVSEISYVSDNIYSAEQIKRMERRICSALNFSLIHNTPHLYVPEFVRASEECPNPCCRSASTSVFHQLVNYLLELGRLPYGPVTKKPSLLSAAAVYLARVTLDVRSNDTSIDPQGRWTRTLEYYTGYAKGDLEDTVKQIHGYYLGAEDSSLKSVFAKYKNKKYGRIALKTVPIAENLGF